MSKTKVQTKAAWLAQKRKVAMALVKTLGHKSKENKEDKLGEKR